ncbi:hypothetical protein AB6A40_005597 [Gnathostoma spinigerum]|uniref:RRM domain-containing protein n=1 Tax=Gnathostoma spinigerum TaxID=75299 RepID=A0ABD6EG22_9BILA
MAPRIGYMDESQYVKDALHADDSDSGWDFWMRFYGDREVQAQLKDKIQSGPTISEILNSDKLCQAQLTFFNVPRVGVGSQQIIRSLIQNECGKKIGIHDIIISNRRWHVRFYRQEHALEVLKVFDGYRFRNRFLSVRYDNICYTKACSTVQSLATAFLQFSGIY